MKNLSANNPLAPFLRWRAAIYEQDYAEALEVLDNWGSDFHENPLTYVPIASWYGVTQQLAGQPEEAERQFQVARVQVEEKLKTTADDPRVYVAYGEALAGLSEEDAAIVAGRRAIELHQTGYRGSAFRLDVIVRVYIPAKAIDTAIAELDAYLAAPGVYSIEGLLPDPRIDPIRDDPRFQALVEKYRRK